LFTEQELKEVTKYSLYGDFAKEYCHIMRTHNIKTIGYKNPLGKVRVEVGFKTSVYGGLPNGEFAI
jgi:hypothetical protein